jgi:hypothetical protein
LIEERDANAGAFGDVDEIMADTPPVKVAQNEVAGVAADKAGRQRRTPESVKHPGGVDAFPSGGMGDTEGPVHLAGDNAGE